jgi:hypothetical protein
MAQHLSDQIMLRLTVNVFAVAVVRVDPLEGQGVVEGADLRNHISIATMYIEAGMKQAM